MVDDLVLQRHGTLSLSVDAASLEIEIRPPLDRADSVLEEGEPVGVDQPRLPDSARIEVHQASLAGTTFGNPVAYRSRVLPEDLRYILNGKVRVLHDLPAGVLLRELGPASEYQSQNRLETFRSFDQRASIRWFGTGPGSGTRCMPFCIHI